jgi:hypothetical protein
MLAIDGWLQTENLRRAEPSASQPDSPLADPAASMIPAAHVLAVTSIFLVTTVLVLLLG